MKSSLNASCFRNYSRNCPLQTKKNHNWAGAQDVEGLLEPKSQTRAVFWHPWQHWTAEFHVKFEIFTDQYSCEEYSQPSDTKEVRTIEEVLNQFQDRDEEYGISVEHDRKVQLEDCISLAFKLQNAEEPTGEYWSMKEFFVNDDKQWPKDIWKALYLFLNVHSIRMILQHSFLC